MQTLTVEEMITLQQKLLQKSSSVKSKIVNKQVHKQMGLPLGTLNGLAGFSGSSERYCVFCENELPPIGEDRIAQVFCEPCKTEMKEQLEEINSSGIEMCYSEYLMNKLMTEKLID